MKKGFEQKGSRLKSGGHARCAEIQKEMRVAWTLVLGVEGAKDLREMEVSVLTLHEVPGLRGSHSGFPSVSGPSVMQEPYGYTWCFQRMGAIVHFSRVGGTK